MDNEVSKGTWTGATVLILVGVIGLALVVYGLARMMTIENINSLSKKLADDNVKELVQLDGATLELTESAILSLIARNEGGISDTTILVPTPGSADAVYVINHLPDYKYQLSSVMDVKEKLKLYAPEILNYTTELKQNVDGTYSLKIYAY